MKLGNLKAAIRATKGNPIIETRLFTDGPTLSLALQKTALLEELDRAYPGGKAVETDLVFDEKTGVLRPTVDAVAHVNRGSYKDAAPEPLDEPVDLDLTGLDMVDPLVIESYGTNAAESTGLDDLFG